MGLVYTATQSTAADIPFAYGYLASEPIAWNVAVEQANDDSESQLDGRFLKQKGYAVGHDTPLKQDTFLNGTPGLSGRDFVAVQNTWHNQKSPYYDNWMLFMPNSTLGQAWEVVSSSTTAGIEAAEIIVHRGFPGVGGVQSDYTPANTNFYLHLAYNQAPYADVRIAGEFGKAIRLDVSPDGSGPVWKPVMSANRYITERFLQDNDDTARFRVWYDKKTTEFWCEVGQDLLHYVLGRSSPGNIRFVGKNGHAGLEYYPVRSQPVTMTKGQTPLVPDVHSNVASARVVINGLSETPEGQNTSYSVETDGLNFGFSVSASLPDAGEGQGSADASVLSDATLLVDEVYTDRIPGDFSLPYLNRLPVVCTEEHQFWDDTNRCLLTSGTQTLNNNDFAISGAFGNVAISINAALIDSQKGSSGYFRRCTGVAGAGEQGIGIIRDDPLRVVRLPFTDKRILMMVALGQEVIFDRWCLYSAVRWIARACNIQSKYLKKIPYWPDGPAGPDCPYPVLGSGTGNNPKYRFTPEISGWSVLLYLASDAGFPISPGLSLPYFTGFDNLGDLRFEPYDPQASLPQVFYSSDPNDIGGAGSLPILGKLEIQNRTSQMRSGVTVQGLDPLYFRLAQVHLATSVAVRKAIGYRHPWLQRSARYGSNIVDIATTSVSAASRPSQIVTFPTVFAPWVQAGGTCIVADPKLGIGVFTIIGIESRWGCVPMRGEREASSVITARNVTAYPTANGILF